ncbi:MAG: PASTA domain-containing protein [Flavobacteriales bacterium]|nr:PASTA domain-containing protein [Flavobacteriales bacterium]
MNLFKFIFSKWFVINVLVGIVVAVFGLYTIIGLLDEVTLHDQTITVPDLSKKSLTEVKEELDLIKLDFKVIDSSAYSSKYPKNSVVKQDPKKGIDVKEGRVIYLTVNPSSYRSVQVPYLVGKSSRQAVSYLRTVGFKIGKFEYRPDIGKNVVLDLKYNGAVLDSISSLPRRSKIDIVLGDGKKGEKTMLPNLVGVNYDDARAKLIELSLNLGNVSYDGEKVDDANYFIYRQYPNYVAGSKLKMGTSIQLWVSPDPLKWKSLATDSLVIE